MTAAPTSSHAVQPHLLPNQPPAFHWNWPGPTIGSFADIT
jgi:hypothetical protein